MLKKMSAKQSEQADLGFGSVVAGESRQRLVNKDGTFNVTRKGLNVLTSMSIYHTLISMSWWKFILIASLGYFLMKATFLFWPVPIITQAFYFSTFRIKNKKKNVKNGDSKERLTLTCSKILPFSLLT